MNTIHNGLMVIPTRGVASVFPVGNHHSGRYPLSLFPRQLYNNDQVVREIIRTNPFTVDNILEGVTNIQNIEVLDFLAGNLFIVRPDNTREEFQKNDRLKLITWIANNPEHPFTTTLLENKHPILFLNPFPDERLIIANQVGPVISANNEDLAFSLGYSIGKLVKYGSEWNQMEELVLEHRSYNPFFDGLSSGIGLGETGTF